ncbi:hypothetical protein WI91_05200 [Burkholderia vietnamiensis]|uniref:hypothetical protein n=1 Tax=Burkholderia vietnamiensis TaxID=60552 RepID=UPI0007578AC4|nr:hypothetical protein [Burkholderia vietnamiensis]KVE08614.1 hypothetical protein WI91_05200 [Burkholderia vietnamiensis]
MKSASESKSAARRLVACAAVALVAPAPAAWAQNSQRADHGTGAPILSPPDTSAQDGGSGMSNGNTAAPPPATRMNDARGKRSHARPHVRTKPGGPSAAGKGGSGGSAGMGGVGAGQAGTGAGAGAGRSSGATGSGGGGAGGTGSAGSSGY